MSGSARRRVVPAPPEPDATAMDALKAPAPSESSASAASRPLRKNTAAPSRRMGSHPHANAPCFPCGWRAALWAFMDDPSSSRGAYTLSLIILALIFTSTMTFILETVQSIKENGEQGLFVAETLCIAVFTVEVGLRVLSAPDYLAYFLDVFTWVDIMAVVPYYLELLLPAAAGAGTLGVIRVVRLVRVARIVKISRYSTSIRIFSQAMVSSVRPLSMLFFLVSIAMIMFSSGMYYAELTDDGCRTGGWEDVAGLTAIYGGLACDPVSDTRWEQVGANGTFVFSPTDANGTAPITVMCACTNPNPFTSIPATFWWCIVTMTTVGYGDHYPVTPLGKVVAILTMLSGIIILALPITVIGTNFSRVLREIQQEKMLTELEALDKNQDGLVDEQELAAMIQHMAVVAGDLPKELIPDARELLKRYDADGSGQLNADETKQLKADMLRMLGRAAEADAVEQDHKSDDGGDDGDDGAGAGAGGGPSGATSPSGAGVGATSNSVRSAKPARPSGGLTAAPASPPVGVVGGPSPRVQLAPPPPAAVGDHVHGGAQLPPSAATRAGVGAGGGNGSIPFSGAAARESVASSAAQVPEFGRLLASRLDDIEERVDRKLVAVIDLLKRMNAAVANAAGTEGVL